MVAGKYGTNRCVVGHPRTFNEPPCGPGILHRDPDDSLQVTSCRSALAGAKAARVRASVGKHREHDAGKYDAEVCAHALALADASGRAR
eukprot:CAMPEP_0174874882 /NCGR_PEP_ID=MMETSP1114-20130205/77480_1 /TAXON_ID=312471 /ORGANISM="Neobodo designis, Strain CCAP 1951/1" /LENGTH=88 /DNA_ID=CAMNT_0016110227 /DNA_START=17 /DNA_END=279 /DNA_ORIENTATION=+